MAFYNIQEINFEMIMSRPSLTERMLMGRKESNQTNKTIYTCKECELEK